MSRAPNIPGEQITRGKSPRDKQSSTLWLNPDLVVDCATKLLFAAQISLGRLNRNVAKQKLNLLQFASGQVAEPSPDRCSITSLFESQAWFLPST
jgi:hypothetical protein